MNWFNFAKAVARSSDIGVSTPSLCRTPECNELISVPPVSRMTASSWRPWHPQQGSCSPDEGHLFSRGGWCALRNNGNQWLQVDLGPPTRVTGVVTKGRGDPRRKHWTTAYLLSYSNDTLRWHHYKDDNHLDPKVSHAARTSVGFVPILWLRREITERGRVTSLRMFHCCFFNVVLFSRELTSTYFGISAFT